MGENAVPAGSAVRLTGRTVRDLGRRLRVSEESHRWVYDERGLHAFLDRVCWARELDGRFRFRSARRRLIREDLLL